jgi:cyclophilin family peptidyl-prolyl cis-trans isomerase/protein-disulfide isomerase
LNRVKMHKLLFGFLLLASALMLVSCAPVPQTGFATLPVAQATVSPLPPTSTPASMTCTILHVPITPEAFPADLGQHAHATGPADAPVTIVVFSDYQCPYCALLAAVLKQIRLTHPNDVRFVFVNTPLSSRDKDALATQAVEAADLQGKFWEMHDLLFDKQSTWSALTPAAFQTWAIQQAAGLGMDTTKFQTDFNGKQVADRLQQALQSTASQPIVPPLMFINGSTPYNGLADFASLDTVVRMEALTARQFSACPPWVIDPLKQYIATLHTAKGDVVIQLFPDKAPLAVDNFVSLARSGWYNGTTFFKVLPGFLVMTGDPSETGMGNTGYLFRTEISADLHFDQAGLVAMDNSGPNTNSGRFFITLSPAEQLYGQYTIFGKVLSGMPVLSGLTARNPQPGVVLPAGDELINITIAGK